MVNVKLMEKSVNSHVGSDIVVKVITQYKIPGSHLSIARRSEARRLPVPSPLATGVSRWVALVATTSLAREEREEA